MRTRKDQWFTVIVACLSGCENEAEVHHIKTRGPKRALASVRAATVRELLHVATFKGKQKTI